MKPVPEREAAKAAGERFYTTGKPCRNGHLSKRYTGTGNCAMCATRNTLKHQAKAPEHPARIAAREAGAIHYSTGAPCKHGHDLRFTANGICVECAAERQRKYHSARPGLHAEIARKYRAKDPTSHRKAASKWAKKNPTRVAANRDACMARNPDLWRKRMVVYVQNRNARKRANGGEFTEADIALVAEEQGALCAGCSEAKPLEVDHVVPVAAGGHNGPSNLQLLCRRCNASKSDKTLSDWLHERFIPPLR
jgi:5-methylcytosine-specific restriction endonuclease McrA